MTTTSAFFEPLGRQPTPAYDLGSLSPGHVVPGPALLIDAISTVVVEPGWAAHVTGGHNVRMEATGEQQGGQQGDGVMEEDGVGGGAAVECDPVRLAIFSHRFMGIAEQMGRTLQVGARGEGWGVGGGGGGGVRGGRR